MGLLESKVLEDGSEPLDHFGVQVEGVDLGVYEMCCRGCLGFGQPMECNSKKIKDDAGNFSFVI